MNTKHRRPWKKNLYENEEYEDNYTDPTFLKDLQKNLNVQTYTLYDALKGAAKLSHQISCVTLFLLIFYYLFMNIITPQFVLVYSSILTVLGYILYIGKKITITTIVDDSRTVMTVLIFGYIFSPLLHTLTDSISTDTIFTTTFFTVFFHLLFFDYGVPAFIVSKAISLNSAIFGAICLSSRLSSSLHAFVLLVVSAQFFVLTPLLLQKIWSPLFLIPTSILCSYLLYNISTTLVIIYILVLIFINVICPLTFVNKQKQKNNIHGPWDEALVDNINLPQQLSLTRLDSIEPNALDLSPSPQITPNSSPIL